MNKIILFAILALVIAGCASNKPAQEQTSPAIQTVNETPAKTFSTYNNHGFTIKYPYDWSVKPGANTNTVIFQSTTGALSVGVQDMGNNTMTLENYTAFNIDQKNKTVTDFNLIEASESTLGSNPASTIVFSGKLVQNGKEMTFTRTQISTIKDNKLYVLEYINSANANGKEITFDTDTLKQMVVSFRINEDYKPQVAL